MRQPRPPGAAVLLFVLCVAGPVAHGGAARQPGAQPGPASADAEIRLQLARLLFDDGRYRDAVDAFRRVSPFGHDAVSIAGRAGLVTSLLRIGEFRVAFDEADAFVQAEPRSAEALSIHGDALWALGRFDRSARAMRDALALDPASPRARHGLARALAAQSRLDAALTEAQAALRLAPSEAEYQYTLGALYQRMNAFDAAAAAFETYLNLLPNRDRSQRAAWARAQVRFLRSFDGRVPLAVAPSGTAQTVPFRLVEDKVVVKARVNGGGHTDFVLDTGAELTIVSQRFAQRAGVVPLAYVRSAGVGEAGLRGLQVGIIDSLQIGTLTIANVPCLIKNPPLSGMPTREAEAFSPLALGMSMRIDYRQRLLTFGASLPRAAGARDLPLWLHRLAMVQGIVNGEPANFVVDTGGEVISISQTTAGRIEPAPAGRRIALRVYGTSGWDRDAFLLPAVDLSFDRLRMPRTAVVVLNLDAPSALLGFQLGGIVGHRFLSRYTVTIDLERSTLALSD